MKWEHNINNLVGNSSLPKEFDDLKDIIKFSIPLVAEQYLMLGNEF
jgi:hypothetical protein